MSRDGRILIIDDDHGTRETLSDVLRVRHHTVATAARGTDGLEHLRRHPIDAAIVDIRLPDTSGVDLLRAIKTASPETEVIFITGHASLATAIQAVNGTAFAYIVKPFEMEHLLAALNQALEKVRLTRALRESEERYRLIAEHISDAVLLLDMEGAVVVGNGRSEELTGHPLEVLRGRSLRSLLTPEGTRELQAGLEAVGAEPGAASLLETEVRRADGSRVLVEVNLTSVVNEGRVVGRLAVVRDLTERKRAEAELQRQRDALFQSEKLAAMGSLLAGVAHELNNPLSVVMGQATLIRETVGEGPIAARVERIVQAADRCARIVQSFLALARRHPPERQRVRLNQVIRDAVDLLAYSLRVDDVTVTLDLAPDLPVLWADPHQLRQVAVNLLSNAHHAMRERPGTRRLTAVTRHDAARERVVLEVADTGTGIPAGIRARIFEPFFTTKPPGEGTGLGLSLCQGTIEAHGGSIWVESPPEGGAVVRVELPVAAPPQDVPVQRPAIEGEPRIRGKRILVVDDEAQVAAVLSESLALDGHRVDTVTNGALALEKLATEPYDLILSDLRMPKLDGPGLYREVEHRFPALARRFIFLTGDTLTERTWQFLAQSGVASLGKPFAPAEVRRVVQRLLREPAGPTDPGP